MTYTVTIDGKTYKGVTMEDMITLSSNTHIDVFVAVAETPAEGEEDNG